MILSIGYCFCNLFTGQIHSKREIIVEYDKDDKRYHVCPSTLNWWSKQGKEAKRVITSKDRIPLADALRLLNRDMSSVGNPNAMRVWGNGSSFDISIIEHAYYTENVPIIWKFWNHRDVRTVVDLCKQLTKYDVKKRTPFKGIPHKADDDAEHEAQYLVEAYRILGEIYEK